MMYKERFEAIELEPCELVMIRELAVNYRKNLLEKYHVESIRELTVPGMFMKRIWQK